MINHEPGAEAVDGPSDLQRGRGRTMVRPVVLLLVTTAALAAFILAVGDARRKSAAMEHVRWYTAELQARVPETGLLPLNLSLDVPPARQTKTYEIVSLPREDVRALRGGSRRVLAAHTPTVLRNLASNGRAVIFFEGDRFQQAWLSSPDFDAISAAQRKEIERLNVTRTDAPPDSP